MIALRRPLAPLVPHRRSPARRLVDRLDRTDRTLFAAAARRESPLLDAVLPPLTTSANHAGLWAVTAAALAAAGQRRAATRGLVSLGVASFAANLPGKLTARRDRPGVAGVPQLRQLRRVPSSSSFPSGHAASAAAFTLGVALERPALGLALAPVAAGVAYGRVHVGVHYPGDVAAGLALGVGCALFVRSRWPARPHGERAAAARATVPALPDGEGLIVVGNADSGDGSARAMVDALLAELPKAEARLVEGDLRPALREAAREARVLGIAGGDGSVNAAAAVALRAGLPLVVVPAGTLNHFAAELCITGVEDVARAVREGTAAACTVGRAADDAVDPEQELVFLNTLSVGVYPELVAGRERREDRLGKWPALAAALPGVLRHGHPIAVRLDGEPRLLWLLFAGNGPYRPAGFAPSWRPRLDDDVIDVRLVRADVRLARTRLALAVLTGRLGRSRVYEQRLRGSLDLVLEEGNGHPRLARDGEIGDAPRDLRLHVAPSRLAVYRPAD